MATPEAYFGDLARWARQREGALAERSRVKRRAFPIDLHHLYYFLLRCDGLGMAPGPLEVDVGSMQGSSKAPSRAQDDVRSMFSFQDTIHTVQTLWGGRPAADPEQPFRYLYKLCARLAALELYAQPRQALQGCDDMPGSHAVPMRAFKGLASLTLNDVAPHRLVGWDRLCLQLEGLQCANLGAADLTDVLVGLVQRDSAQDAVPRPLPAAAWHTLHYLNLAGNELTFVPSTALRALPALVHLDLSHNLLNAVPPALEHLPHLCALNLSDNMIDSVLGIYDALPAIRSLNLAANRLESLCGLERLKTLEQVDLRTNLVEDVGEVGRLAMLPRISHVWIDGNPIVASVPDVRVAVFTLFALEHKEIKIDDQACGFLEQRRVAQRVAKQAAPVRDTPTIEAQIAPDVRRVTLATAPQDDARRRRPRRTDPGPLAQPEQRKRKPRRSELPRPDLPRNESLKQRIERLRGDAGDDWLREFARNEFDEQNERRDYPVHAIDEDAPAAALPTPFRLALEAVSTPAGAALVTVGVLVGGRIIRRRFFHRYPTAAHLTPNVLRTRRMLVGTVTSVGDADGFRLYHTPGLPFLRDVFFKPPKNKSQLRNETISVRIAGADAPEAAHFGREAQPFADEAKEELKRLVLGKTVWLDMAHIDQYQRLVATPYVWRPPYIFGRTNVSLTMVRKGLATVYRNAGAAYGQATWLSKTLFHATSGRKRLERAEEYAKIMRIGMWSLGKKLETPGEFKRRMRDDS